MSDIYYAEKPEDLPSQQQMLAMSGLEFMQAILTGRISAPPIAKLLNFELYSVEEGRVAFRGRPEFRASNPMGTLHGGWYGTILDSCMACAVMTTVPQGSAYTTLEYKVNIIRPIPIGTLVEATGTLQHGGRSTGVSVGEVRGVEDGRLYATGSTTCIVMKLG